MRKLKHTEVKELAQGHAAGKRKRQNVNSGSAVWVPIVRASQEWVQTQKKEWVQCFNHMVSRCLQGVVFGAHPDPLVLTSDFILTYLGSQRGF